MSTTVLQADAGSLNDVAALFDAYRQFYGQEADVASATEFLTHRFERKDAVILLARRVEEAVGFVQLYPSFSSVAMRRLWILNDLYVKPTSRRWGVGERLLSASVEYAEASGAVRLVLATANDNLAAQALYEKLGWKGDETFRRYVYALSGN